MNVEVDVTEKGDLFSIMVLLENLPRVFEARKKCFSLSEYELLKGFIHKTKGLNKNLKNNF